MECNGEISDTDSGIILHSGSDSPTTHTKDVVSTHTKDVTTHTRAMKLKHQALQDRLELCVLELKKLCIREAELTGQLSADYPLLPGEKPPQIRRRIGAAFKLDEQSILQGAEESELDTVDAELSLQMKIYEASRKLLQEEHLSKGLKKSRQQQCKREERKLKELQDTSFQLRLQRGRNVTLHDQGNSDDSSLSDSAVLDEEAPSQGPTDPPLPVPTPPPTSSPLPPCATPSPLPPCATPSPLTLAHRQTSRASLESSQSFNSSVSELYDAPPIQHSPWTESSLDQPYEKKKKSRSSTTSSKCSSPASPQVLPPLEAVLGGTGSSAALTGTGSSTALPQKLSHLKLRHTVSNSTPCTPEMQVRRQLSLRLPNNNNTESSRGDQENRGRVRAPRRRLTEYSIALPPEGNYGGHAASESPCYGSRAASEDSNSEHSSSTTSYASSPCQDLPPADPRQYPAFQPQHFSPVGPPPPSGGMGPSPQPPPPPPFPNPGSGGGFYQNPRHQSSPSFHRSFYAEELGGGGGYLPPLDHVDMARTYYGHQQAPPCPNGRHDYSPNYRYMEAPVHHPHHHHPQHRAAPARGVLLPPDPRLSRSPSLWEHHHQQHHPDHHYYQDHPLHHQAHSNGLPRQVVNEELCSWHQRSTIRGPGPRGGGRPPRGGGPPPRPRSLDRQGAVRVKNPAAGRESPLFQRRQQYQPPEQQMNQRRVHPQRPAAVDDSPLRCWTTDDNSEIFSQV